MKNVMLVDTLMKYSSRQLCSVHIIVLLVTTLECGFPVMIGLGFHLSTEPFAPLV